MLNNNKKELFIGKFENLFDEPKEIKQKKREIRRIVTVMRKIYKRIKMKENNNGNNNNN